MLNQISDNDLVSIVKSTSFSTIKTICENEPSLMEMAKRRSAHLKSSRYKGVESFIDILNPLNYLFMLVDNSFTLITSITALAFSIAGVGFFALFALIGIVHFVGKYKEMESENEEMDNGIELLALRKGCVDEYIRRRSSKEVQTECQPVHPNAASSSNKEKWQNAREVLGAMILTTGILFYTYYAVTLAFTVALVGSAIVGAMAGPIGVGVALAISFAMGIYCGYKKHQRNQHHQSLERERYKMSVEFDRAYGDFRQLRLKTKETKPAPISEAGADVSSGAFFERSNKAKNRVSTATQADLLPYFSLRRTI